MSYMIKCYICGTQYEGGDTDPCPYCGWGYTGIEKLMEPNEKDSFNLISIEEAKANVAKGFDIYGEDPLPKKQQ